MNRLLILLLVIGTICWSVAPVKGQIAYGIYGNYFTVMDLSDCSLCQLFPTQTGGDDLTVLTDGRIIFINEMVGLIYDAQGNILNSFNCPHEIQSNCLHNGVLYLGTSGGLYTLNLTNYLVTFVGGWAPGMHSIHGLYSLNGNVYSTNLSNNGGRPIWQVNITDPTQSTFVQNMPAGTFQPRGVSSAGGLMYYSTFFPPVIPASIWSYDQATNTSTQLCSYPWGQGPFWGLSVLPTSTAPITCPCVTSAGAIPSPAINLCGTVPLNGPSTSGPILESDDILRYFLVTNPGSITTSIVAVSTTPNFTFNPATMTLNTTYYLVAGAGDNLNGSINFADPCLNFSNAIPVTWRPLPEVSFSSVNPATCSGTCEDITVSLTGNPPFSLTYTTPFASNQAQVFPSNSGLLIVCPPAGSPPGSLLLQAIALSDAFCTCP